MVLLVLSISGLTRADITSGVFRPINHQILGLSSRSVSLVRYTLHFHAMITGAINHVLSFIIHQVIPVAEVEAVNVCVNVNSCRSVVAVRLAEVHVATPF